MTVLNLAASLPPRADGPVAIDVKLSREEHGGYALEFRPLGLAAAAATRRPLWLHP